MLVSLSLHFSSWLLLLAAAELKCVLILFAARKGHRCSLSARVVNLSLFFSALLGDMHVNVSSRDSKVEEIHDIKLSGLL